MNEQQEAQLAITKEQVDEGLSMWKRIALFRQDMTMREVRLLKKCQEDPNDTEGVVVGVLWLINRRANPQAEFSTYLDYKESEVIAELEEKLPKGN